MVWPSVVEATPFSRSLPVCRLHANCHASDPNFSHWNAHQEHIWSFTILMKGIHLTAVLICDLLVLPERSHSPSIGWAHREACSNLQHRRSLEPCFKREPSPVFIKAWQTPTTGSTQPHFEVLFSDKKESCSIHKSVYGLGSCRYNGNILRLRSYTSCLLVLAILFPFLNLLVFSRHLNGLCYSTRDSYKK